MTEILDSVEIKFIFINGKDLPVLGQGRLPLSNSSFNAWI